MPGALGFNPGWKNLKTKKNFETPWLGDSTSNFLTLAGDVSQIYRQCRVGH